MNLSFKQTINIIAVVNIIFIIFIYADYFIPSKDDVTSTVQSIDYNLETYAVCEDKYNYTEKNAVEYLLILKNSDTIRFYKYPDILDSAKENQSIRITFTSFLHKVKSVELLDLKLKENTSLIGGSKIMGLLCIALLISISRIISNKTPEILVGIGMIISFYTFISYFCYIGD